MCNHFQHILVNKNNAKQTIGGFQRDIREIELGQKTMEQNLQQLDQKVDDAEHGLEQLESNPPIAPIKINGTSYKVRYIDGNMKFSNNSRNFGSKTHKKVVMQKKRYCWPITVTTVIGAPDTGSMLWMVTIATMLRHFITSQQDLNHLCFCWALKAAQCWKEWIFSWEQPFINQVGSSNIQSIFKEIEKFNRYHLDLETKMMKVSICPTEQATDCGVCQCAVGNCVKTPFGGWLHFNCDDLRGNYMRLTNEDGRNWLVFAEVEAFGYIN